MKFTPWDTFAAVNASLWLLALMRQYAIIFSVNSKHRATLDRIWAEPINGNLEWTRIEALLKALGSHVIEGAASSVTFEFRGCKVTLHRPHPGKAALRYRVSAVREFLLRIGVKP